MGAPRSKRRSDVKPEAVPCGECGRCRRCGRPSIPGRECLCVAQPKCQRCGAWINSTRGHDCRMDRPYDLLAAFHNRLSMDSASGCWLWQGRLTQLGYGLCPLGQKGKRVLAHRLSYELFIERIPDGLYVCHKCDTPKCVNPKHLFLGTAKDNRADCLLKGRWKCGDRRHEHNGAAKLTWAAVEEIRQVHADGRVQRFRNEPGRMSTKDLAAKFGVCTQSIYHVVRGEKWVS